VGKAERNKRESAKVRIAAQQAAARRAGTRRKAIIAVDGAANIITAARCKLTRPARQRLHLGRGDSGSPVNLAMTRMP